MSSGPDLITLSSWWRTRSDLDAWAGRLDELAVAHAGVREPPYTANAMITFRDPDNIQPEFFWRAPGL
jgi:heme-degrading monooxygenase HmoA